MTGYRRYLLIVLLVIQASNYVDRLALGLLLQDIKAELALTDTQLGLLTGLAFAVFYSVMGLPIARWADHGDRRAIIAVTTAIWSVAVALCGAAASFAQLLLIRIGVAIGEAGCIPPAHSLIADYFSREERPRALAIYLLGGPLSVLLGYFAAGWLNEFYGWRATFLYLGLPGLALAALAWWTIKEPRLVRAADTVHAGSRAGHPRVRDVCLLLWRNKTLRNLLLCFSVASFFNYGVQQWKPAFFQRSFGIGTGELGTWLALIFGVGGLLGTYAGGVWASRYAGHDESFQFRVVAAAYILFGIVSAGLYLASDIRVAFALLALSALGVHVAMAPMYALAQTMLPANMRAVAIAVIYLVSNLVGMGLGPLAAGVLSEQLRPFAGDESLRYALLALCPGYLWVGWFAWQASRSVVTDLDLAR